MKTLIMALFMLWPITVNAADLSHSLSGGSDENVIMTATDAGLTYNRNYYITPGIYRGKRMGASVTYSSITVSNVAFSTNAITMNSANIAITAHGLTLGLDVLLRATSGTVPGPLVAETTYYAINSTVDIVQLATTSAQAIARDPIVLVSSTTTGTQTYTLIPLAYTGTPSFKWQSSNNGSDWADVNTSSITMSAPTFTTSMWDFDYVSFSDYRLAIIAPTAGAMYIKSVVNLVR